MNWISVKERLPEEGIKVLAVVVGQEEIQVGPVEILHRSTWERADPEDPGEGWTLEPDLFLENKNVTHWQNLPHPPEGE